MPLQCHCGQREPSCSLTTATTLPLIRRFVSEHDGEVKPLNVCRMPLRLSVSSCTQSAISSLPSRRRSEERGTTAEKTRLF